MTEDHLFACLNELDHCYPFKGLTAIKIDERPLIKGIAQLAGLWETIRHDLQLVRHASLIEGGSGSCALYAADPAESGARMFLILKTTYRDNRITSANAVLLLAEPEALQFAEPFGRQLTETLAKDHLQGKILFEYRNENP